MILTCRCLTLDPPYQGPKRVCMQHQIYVSNFLFLWTVNIPFNFLYTYQWILHAPWMGKLISVNPSAESLQPALFNGWGRLKVKELFHEKLHIWRFLPTLFGGGYHNKHCGREGPYKNMLSEGERKISPTEARSAKLID